MTLLSGALLFKELPDGPPWASILAYGVLGLVFLLVVLLTNEFHLRASRTEAAVAAAVTDLRRAEGQARALPALHDVEHSLRDAHWELFNTHNANQLDRVYERLQDSLRHVAEAYTAVTGVACRVCIKEVIGDLIDNPPKVEDLKVRTLVRHNPADAHPGRDAEAPITHSSAFFHLVKELSPCFVVSDFADADPSLRSHSKENHPVPNDYRSTIVFPIQKRRDRPNRTLLLAFLSVDAKQPATFNTEDHFDVGAAVADSLFGLLLVLRDRFGKPLTSPTAPADTGPGQLPRGRAAGPTTRSAARRSLPPSYPRPEPPHRRS